MFEFVADTPALRADARRNADRIVGAAIDCLAADPGASMASIAKAAGVGRVTLYGHFETRDALVEAAMNQALAESDAAIELVELPTEPTEALRAVIAATWQQTARVGALVAAVRRTLSSGQAAEAHADHRARIRDLLERGRADGSIRTDMPVEWLEDVMSYVLHGAAADVAEGRLAPDDAARLIPETVLAIVARANT